MRKHVIFLLLLTPAILVAQIKGKNSKDPFKTTSGTTYKKGDVITLADASNESKFAYVYTYKSSLSFGNIVKTVKNVNDVKNLSLKNTNGIKNAINTTKNISRDDLLKTSVKSLQNKVVSEKYVSENALEAKMKGNKYKIKSFKIYTDKESEKQVVHAIAKGKKGKIAILIDLAEQEGEI